MTDDEFEAWMTQNGYEPGSQTYILLTSMRTALITATRTAEKAIKNATTALESINTAQKAKEAAQKKNETLLKTPKPSLPTPRRLAALKPGIRQPVRSDQFSAGYQTWDAQLPSKFEAVPPIFGGLFKNSDDKIIPWSGTDPDSSVNCFTWDTTLSE